MLVTPVRVPAEPVALGRAAGHGLFAAVLALGAALRVLVMLGYDTAQLYWYDSFTYLDDAVHLRPGDGFHPAGYPVFLRLLLPFHSVELIAAVQHAMGLGIAVMIYLVLRRHALPGWGATLATLPVLFNPAFVRLEHAVLSDVQVIFFAVAAMTVLLRRPVPSTRASVLAGAFLAVAALTRTAALPLLVLFLLHLLLRRAGRRRVVAGAAAALLPLAGYACWYHQHHGRFALSGSDGVALWARTMTFADCATIRPPAAEARLCPNGTVVDAASEYVWAAGASLNRLPGDRFAHNDLARSFALRAIAAQPLDYLADVVRDTSLAFRWTPVRHPARVSPALSFPKGSWPLPGFPLIDQVRREYDPDIRGLSSVEPYASVLEAYRYPVVLYGPLFAALLVAGGIGAVRRRAALLPWLASAALLVGPVAALDFDHRYLLPAIPLACLAAGLGAGPANRSARTGTRPRRAAPWGRPRRNAARTPGRAVSR